MFSRAFGQVWTLGKFGPPELLSKLGDRRHDELLRCLDRRRPRERPVLFQDVARRYLAWAEHERPRSLVFRQRALAHLLPAFGPLLLKDITAEQIDGYLQARRGSRKRTDFRERRLER